MSFDYMSATPDEIRAEVLRRQRAKGAWRGEEPLSPAQQRRKEMLLEKDVQARVIKLYVRHGCKVRVYSQPRKAKYMTPGGADLQIFSPHMEVAEDRPISGIVRTELGDLARHVLGESPLPDAPRRRRVMFYHETKKPKDGRYSDDQLLFAADCLEAGIVVVGGGVEEAQAQLDRLGLKPQ